MLRRNFVLFLLFMNQFICAQQTEKMHVLFFYDIKSSGQHLTDNDCQKYYSLPLRYIIEHDKPRYLTHPYLTVKSYQRQGRVVIDDKNRLYTGMMMISYPNKPNQLLKQHLNFIHAIKRQMVEGSFYVTDYCHGHFIGVEEFKNKL